MIRIFEVTKQDRLSVKILTGITGLILAARSKIPYDDWIKNGLTNDNLEGLIDFGIAEGAFMPSYKLKDWLDSTKDFFDTLPPRNILTAIYKELQKYPQGSIRGYS